MGDGREEDESKSPGQRQFWRIQAVELKAQEQLAGEFSATLTAYQKEPPSHESPTGGDATMAGAWRQGQESQTGGKAMGRPPADEPDVFVVVPEVHVGELSIDVQRLEAHLALRHRSRTW